MVNSGAAPLKLKKKKNYHMTQHLTGGHIPGENLNSKRYMHSNLLSSPSPPAFSISQHQSFPVSQFFTSGSQRIEVSASASVL